MSHLDATGQGLLDRLAALHEPGLFADVPEASGTDTNGALSLTLDAARRVVCVRVLDIGPLRGPEAFLHALHTAFSMADGARALAALEEHGTAEEFLARAEARLADGVGARPPGPVEVPTGPAPAPMTSDNGYLTVKRNARGRLVRAEVDAEWLSGATPERMERAVEQACRFGTEQ